MIVVRNTVALAFIVIFAAARAEIVSLTGDTRLTGTMRSVGEAGTSELLSILSTQPIALQPEAIEKIDFNDHPVTTNPHETLIELVNGDFLTANIEKLDAQNLIANSSEIGRFTIPRTALKSILHSGQKKKPIYTGPNDAKEWIYGTDESKQWNFTNNALKANGLAYAAREFKLPNQFTLKFILKWRASPNLQVSFADPLAAKIEAVDRYYLQINTAGIEIKRESSKGKRFQTLILSTLAPDQFPDNQVSVEIKVDRTNSQLDLILNGELVDSCVDPSADSPQGNGISIVNSAETGLSQEIQNIEILEIDHKDSQNDKSFENSENDRLIRRNNDRLEGFIVGISRVNGGNFYQFKTDSQSDPLVLSEEDISAVLFKQSAEARRSSVDHLFALRLTGDGLLGVSSCKFSDEYVTVIHPLIGLLKIKRTRIISLERMSSKSNDKKE